MESATHVARLIRIAANRRSARAMISILLNITYKILHRPAGDFYNSPDLHIYNYCRVYPQSCCGSGFYQSASGVWYRHNKCNSFFPFHIKPQPPNIDESPVKIIKGPYVVLDHYRVSIANLNLWCPGNCSTKRGLFLHLEWSSSLSKTVHSEIMLTHSQSLPENSYSLRWEVGH